MRINPSVPGGLLVVLLIASCESFTEVLGPTLYGADLTGAQVQPTPVGTNATGTFTGNFHPSDGELDFTLAWDGLSGPAISAHIHGPANVNTVGELIVDFSALPSGSLDTLNFEPTGSVQGKLDLRQPMTPTVSGDSLKVLLDRGLAYVDVHTAVNVNGEIRGQLRVQ
jgi:hypothetical protein